MSERSHTFWTQFVDRAISSRVMLLALALVCMAVLAGPSNWLGLDESIESFFAPDDPLLTSYQYSKVTFGGDEFVIVGYEVDEPTSTTELNRQLEFANKLSALKGVRAESTQHLHGTLRNPRATGIERIAMRMPTTERKLIELSRRVLIGDDDRTVSIALRLVPEAESPVSRAETFHDIRRIAGEFSSPTAVAGEPLQVHDMFRYVDQDSWLLGWASSILLMAVMLIMFRSWRWVLLPLLVIQMTLISTRGLLYFSGLKLSMVSSMLTSLVTIICIATVMHITVTYRHFRTSMQRQDAFRATFARLGPPIFYTCLTTAIGFASLITSSVTPVRSFGLMMTIGTLLVPIVCVLVVPSSVLMGSWQADPLAPPAEGVLVRTLQGLARRVNRFSGVILFSALGVAGLFFSGLGRLEVETDFSKNFREESPIVSSLQFFEEKLGGVGSWEIGFSAPEELTEEYLDEVRALADELRDLRLDDGTQLTKVIVVTDGLDLVPKIPIQSKKKGRRPLLRLIPKFRLLNLEERQEMVTALQPEMLPSLYDPEQKRMRIMLRSLEQQPAEVKLELIQEVERVAQKRFPEAKATGLYVLLANLIVSLLNDQLISFSIAAIGVTLTMGIAFRSFWIGLISIVPNVLPILMVIGGMGWLGMPINIGTAMMASVSMGLTVDSTIHYLSAYQRARREGMTHLLAIELAHGDVGLALVLANIALVAGFSVLALSNFVPLIYFGALVSIAMVGGLVCNLLVLPALLGLIAKPQPTS